MRRKTEREKESRNCPNPKKLVSLNATPLLRHISCHRGPNCHACTGHTRPQSSWNISAGFFFALYIVFCKCDKAILGRRSQGAANTPALYDVYSRVCICTFSNFLCSFILFRLEHIGIFCKLSFLFFHPPVPYFQSDRASSLSQ